MKPKLLLILLLVLTSHAVRSAEGLATLTSAHSVSETVDRLESALKAQDFRIFARIDHAGGAASVDLALPPTELLIFGKPLVGTRLMQGERSIGIDLPMKYLVWEAEDGTVFIGWNDGVWMAERHGLDAEAAVVQNVAGALRKFASEAAQ